MSGKRVIVPDPFKFFGFWDSEEPDWPDHDRW